MTKLLFTLLIPCFLTTPTFAEDSAKKDFQKIGQDFKALGQSIGKEAKEAGLAVGKEAKKAGLTVGKEAKKVGQDVSKVAVSETKEIRSDVKAESWTTSIKNFWHKLTSDKEKQ